MNKQLHVPADTCRYLEERSITVHVAETREAVTTYNDLAGGTLVAGAVALHLLTSPLASTRT